MHIVTRKLLEDVADHFVRHDGFLMEEGVDYPGYPDRREAEARALHGRIQRILDKPEGKDGLMKPGESPRQARNRINGFAKD